MRILTAAIPFCGTALAALFLAAPAAAKPPGVPQCEQQATATDAAVQAYLQRKDSGSEGEATKKVNSFETSCMNPYMCPAFELWWGEWQGSLLKFEDFRGKPDWFAKTFADLKKTCKRK